HAGHVIMNWVFLASGYIYYWEVIGPDPLPFRAPTNLRLLVLFFSMPLHLFAGVYLMQLQSVLGVEFYESLGLPHAGHVIMNWVFLASGYIYYWEVIGPDPLPFRAP
ncbi:cytochrome c oxidase assembly protein, partial [Bacteroides fragilis]|nr:cytochrome c oxidase assembly protein [Bacteroides fragilis]